MRLITLFALLGLLFGFTTLSGCSSAPVNTSMAQSVAQSAVATAPRIAPSLMSFAPVKHAELLPSPEPVAALNPDLNTGIFVTYDRGRLTTDSTLQNTAIQAAAETVPVADVTTPPQPQPQISPLLVRPEYTLGAGDIVKIAILGDDQISGTYTVGPDGKVGVPIAGVLMLAGLTREQTAELFAKSLEKKLAKPSITVNIIQYNNNHVFVLGRVLRPGQIELHGEGRLLQALAAAGVQAPNQSATGQQAGLLPARCSIVRGNQTAIWIDLERLLYAGDLSLNVPLNNNDLVFLPDVEEENVFVLGAVGRPGAIAFRPKLSLIDAISLAGGITNDGRYNDVLVSRRLADGEFGQPQEFDIRRIMEKGQVVSGLELNAGDVVYVRRSNMAKVGLFFQRVGPGMQMLSVGSNLFDTFHRSNSATDRRTTVVPTP